MKRIEIINKHYKAIYRLCLRRTDYNSFQAEECTQAVFETLLMNWDEVQNKNIEKWLFKTADNKLKEYYRKRAKDNSIIPLEDAESETADRSELCDKVISDEDIELYKTKILQSLSESERELYRDYFERKMSYGEIAEKLGIKYTTAQMRVRKLKSALTDKVNETFCLAIGSGVALKVLVSLFGNR